MTQYALLSQTGMKRVTGAAHRIPLSQIGIYKKCALLRQWVGMIFT